MCTKVFEAKEKASVRGESLILLKVFSFVPSYFSLFISARAIFLLSYKMIKTFFIFFKDKNILINPSTVIRNLYIQISIIGGSMYEFYFGDLITYTRAYQIVLPYHILKDGLLNIFHFQS